MHLIPGLNRLEKTWVISDSSSLVASQKLALAGNSGAPWMIENPAKLERRLLNAMRQMVSLGEVVTAEFSPVSAIAPVQFSENLFVSVFSAKGTPDWQGNIKKLKLLDGDSDGVFDKLLMRVARHQNPASKPPGPEKVESILTH